MTPDPDFEFGIQNDDGGSISPPVLFQLFLQFRLNGDGVGRIASTAFAVEYEQGESVLPNEISQKCRAGLAASGVMVGTRENIEPNWADAESVMSATQPLNGLLHILVSDKYDQILGW